VTHLSCAYTQTEEDLARYTEQRFGDKIQFSSPDKADNTKKAIKT